MTNYQEVRVKLTSPQLNKLKFAAKYKTETISRSNKKNFEDEEFPHELFLTTRQTINISNIIANNMSPDKELSGEEISNFHKEV